MQRRLQEILRSTDEECKAWAADNDRKKKEIEEARKSKTIPDRACELVNDLRDMSSNLVGVCASNEEHGHPLVLKASYLAGGSSSDEPTWIPEAVWQRLMDPIDFAELHTKFKKGCKLVGQQEIVALQDKKSQAPSYCLRAGRCVCGLNIRFCCCYKRLRTSWTRHFDSKEEKTATLVVEVLGSIADVGPDGGERLFFHVAMPSVNGGPSGGFG
jgi:hypothetical protein